MGPDGVASLCSRGQSQGGTHPLAICKLPARTFCNTVPMPSTVGALWGGPFDVGRHCFLSGIEMISLGKHCHLGPPERGEGGQGSLHSRPAFLGTRLVEGLRTSFSRTGLGLTTIPSSGQLPCVLHSPAC